MTKDMRLSLILSAKDRLSSVIRSSVTKSDEAFNRLEGRLDGIAGGFEKIGMKAVIAGGALVGAGALNLKAAADFESSMASVSTLCDDLTDDIAAMSREVLQIGKRTPVALDQLSSALYDIRSAGISAADQFNVLEKSAQLGVAGLGSTKEAVDLVTSSINAFKLAGEEQNKLYDNIFKTIKTGKTTITGLAQGFGAVAGTVAAAGIKIDDYLASIAALTTTGQPAAQAHTQMKAAIAGLTRNTKEQQLIFRQLGAKDFGDLITKSGSVVTAFEGINRSVRGNKAKLIELLGSVEAYNAVLSLTGNQNKAWAETIDAMRNGADLFASGYEKKLNTINAQLQRSRNLISKISIDFGTALIPGFTRLLNGVERVMDGIDRMPEGLRNFMSVGTVALGACLLAFGSLNLVISTGVKQFKELLTVYRNLTLFMGKYRFTTEVKMLRTLGRTVKIDVGASVIGLRKNIALLPGMIKNTTLQMYACSRASLLAFPGQVAMNANKLKTALIGIPSHLKKAIAGFRALNVTLALNPIGLVAAGIAGAAFLIFKYWKPISGYFRGIWSGIVEATRPLQPIFQGVGNAVKPLINWVSRLIKPVDDVGGKAESLGKKVGLAIGGAITGMVNFIAKVGEVIKKIVTLNGLIGGKKGKSVQVSVGAPVDGSHANGLARVPYDGYIAELHEGERVLTEREALDYGSNFNNSAVYHVVFNPVINARNIKDIKELESMVERLQRKFLAELKTEQRRKEARSYAGL